jgi:hypothetical protein
MPDDAPVIITTCSANGRMIGDAAEDRRRGDPKPPALPAPLFGV